MNDDQRIAGLVDTALEATVVLSFTRLGIAARRQFGGWEADHPSMAGKTVLVTGASSGLGKAAATELARLGASVWLLVRNEDKGQSTQDEIIEATGHDDVSFLLADLAELDTVRDFAAELRANIDRLDVVIHNAGALSDTRTETTDGIELTFQTHVVAPFLLTTELLPLLEAASGRIITVASGGLYTQSLAIEDLQSEQDYRGSVAYARAKRAQVLLNETWAEHLEPLGITAHAMHPGWADTPGIEASLPKFRQITGSFLRTPEEGADTMVWLAGAPEEVLGTGRFWMDRKPRATHKVPWTRSGDAHRGELWDQVATLAGVSEQLRRRGTD